MGIDNRPYRYVVFNADDFGITPEELVGDDYDPTQTLASRLRADGVPGLVAPSSALPGTESVTLFGPRTLSPFLFAPIDPDDQLATAHTAEKSRPADEVVPLVRWFGDAHAGLAEWRATGDGHRADSAGPHGRVTLPIRDGASEGRAPLPVDHRRNGADVWVAHVASAPVSAC